MLTNIYLLSTVLERVKYSFITIGLVYFVVGFCILLSMGLTITDQEDFLDEVWKPIHWIKHFLIAGGLIFIGALLPSEKEIMIYASLKAIDSSTEIIQKKVSEYNSKTPDSTLTSESIISIIDHTIKAIDDKIK